MMQSSTFKAIFAAALIFAIINGSNGFKRIVGGSTTNIESFPYTVEIGFMLEGNYSVHLCGGSLIRPDWVVSAAHCFQPDLEYYVKAGVTNVDQNEGERRKPKQIYKLGAYTGHPGSMGDIVLIQLESPLPINKKIQTIPLPPSSTGDIPLGIAVASGWGYSGYQDGQLRYANLPIKDQTFCKNFWETKIKEDMFCAGNSEGMPGTCNGDSGGPLVLNGVLYGVVSWGAGLCEENNLGVFVKVPYYVDKIENIIANTP